MAPPPPRLVKTRMKPESTCVWIVPASKESKKKYVAQFMFPNGNKKRRPKSVGFGARGFLDFTIHKDSARKKRYLARHGASEGGQDWTKFDTPGALSRYVLWNKETLLDSIKDYTKTFGLTRCVSPQYWGAATWNMLHYCANHPNATRADVRNLTTAVSKSMPCSICRKHFQNELATQKRERKKMGVCCTSRDLIFLHNGVNRRLKKRVLDLEEAEGLNKRRSLERKNIQDLINLFEWNFSRQGKMNEKNKNFINTIKKITFKFLL